jgi:3-oxoacyl-[acyl-carrier protein] reductase
MSRVLVTGASRGIGRAVARAFAARGDRVVVHYATARADAEETLKSLFGEGHALVGGPIENAAERIVDEAAAALGGLDVLVNNAAVAPGPGNRHRIDEVSYEDWQRTFTEMIGVGLLGTANVTYCFAQHLIRCGTGGSIVNVGSRGAFRGEPDYPAYGAAKAALHALGQSLAVALAPHNISVTSVAPGFVATDRQAARLSGPESENLLNQSPFGRVGTPEEVAAAVVYLSSTEARWSSGAVLDLNGASYLRT